MQPTATRNSFALVEDKMQEFTRNVQLLSQNAQELACKTQELSARFHELQHKYKDTEREAQQCTAIHSLLPPYQPRTILAKIRAYCEMFVTFPLR